MQPKSEDKGHRPAGQAGLPAVINDETRQCFDMVKTQFGSVRDAVKAACGSSLTRRQRDKASTSTVDATPANEEFKMAWRSSNINPHPRAV
jgi:hypothetical protein